MTTTIERLVDQLRRSAEGDAVTARPCARCSRAYVEDAPAHPIPAPTASGSWSCTWRRAITSCCDVSTATAGSCRRRRTGRRCPTPTEDAWRRRSSRSSRSIGSVREAVATFPADAARRAARRGSAVFRLHTIHRDHPARPLPRRADHAPAPGPPTPSLTRVTVGRVRRYLGRNVPRMRGPGRAADDPRTRRWASPTTRIRK